MTAPHDDIEDLLAAYALDALEPEEITRLLTLLDEHPQLRTVLAELRSTADKLPYGLPEAIPHPDLRRRILQRATDGTADGRPSAVRRPTWLRPSWLLALSGVLLALQYDTTFTRSTPASPMAWGMPTVPA